MVSRRWQSCVQDSTGTHDTVEIPEIQIQLQFVVVEIHLPVFKHIVYEHSKIKLKKIK